MVSKKYKIACVIGTRPEVIKMAPIIYALRKQPSIKTVIISTGQHRELLQSMLDLFKIKVDVDLKLMKKNQTLSNLTGEECIKLGKLLSNHNYDMILAQGDTTTTFVAALTAFYLHIPFGHIEAGLRSNDIYHPYPEEMNRLFVAKIATLHFAPTLSEQKNLLHEDIRQKDIFVTGNTGIDALKIILKTHKNLPFKLPVHKRIILVTIHHRENFGKPLQHIFAAILQLADLFKDVFFIYPVHPNPNIKKIAYAMLGKHASIKLTDPLSYDVFCVLMKKSYLIMTDSGGIEEEAPVLGKPLIILRDKTERTKVVEMGMGKLVGYKTKRIVKCTTQLLTQPKLYNKMVKKSSPYGDGHAAEKIVKIILKNRKKLRQLFASQS